MDVKSAVAHALQMAECLQVRKGHRVRIAVLSGSGELVAMLTLRGEQVLLFREQLEPLGFRESEDDKVARRLVCDLVLQQHSWEDVAGGELLVPSSVRWPPPAAGDGENMGPAGDAPARPEGRRPR